MCLTITIEIPVLDRYLDWLREQDQIPQLTAQVEDLTARLQQSAAALHGAVQEEK